MGSETTPRDRVWAAIIEEGKNGNNFKVGSIRRKIDFEERPSDETIRRVLRSAKDLGVVSHRSGSQYYRLADAGLARRVQ